MTVMMTAESWMHEYHDHRVEHDDEEWELDSAIGQSAGAAAAGP